MELDYLVDGNTEESREISSKYIKGKPLEFLKVVKRGKLIRQQQADLSTYCIVLLIIPMRRRN